MRQLQIFVFIKSIPGRRPITSAGSSRTRSPIWRQKIFREKAEPELLHLQALTTTITTKLVVPLNTIRLPSYFCFSLTKYYHIYYL
jgi:hypothetical protein